MAGRDLLAIDPADPLPHFVQVGSVPVFQGAGPTDLICPCGTSTLIRGYLANNYLAISIKCFRCGRDTVTPGMPSHEILPRSAIAVEALQRPMVTTLEVARGTLLVCSKAMSKEYVRTRPANPPDEPLGLSRRMLETAASDYDRLSGGSLRTHLSSSPLGSSTDQGTYPFAWALLRLEDRVDQPGWSWLHQDDDAIAAMHITALHHLMQCWGQHPLLMKLGTPLAKRDWFIPTVTTLAIAKLLHEAGNRVGFSLSGNDVGLHFTTPSDEPLSLVLRAPEALQWRQKALRSPESLRLAVIEAIASARGTVNRNRPGIVILAASILQPDFDQMIVDAIHAAFQSIGRRHPGVAAVAVVMPKVLPAGALDRVGFGYAFYPIRNPHFAGNNPVQLGPARN